MSSCLSGAQEEPLVAVYGSVTSNSQQSWKASEEPGMRDFLHKHSIKQVEENSLTMHCVKHAQFLKC